jgi:hypothetical protein
LFYQTKGYKRSRLVQGVTILLKREVAVIISNAFGVEPSGVTIVAEQFGPDRKKLQLVLVVDKDF